jgi:hypothetical protein
VELEFGVQPLELGACGVFCAKCCRAFGVLPLDHSWYSWHVGHPAVGVQGLVCTAGGTEVVCTGPSMSSLGSIEIIVMPTTSALVYAYCHGYVDTFYIFYQE